MTTKPLLQKFKKKLRWDETEKWFDCGGIGILAYAVVSNEENVVERTSQSSETRFQRRRVY